MIHSYQTSCTAPSSLPCHRVVALGPLKQISNGLFVCLFVRSRICKIELSFLWVVVPTHYTLQGVWSGFIDQKKYSVALPPPIMDWGGRVCYVRKEKRKSGFADCWLTAHFSVSRRKKGKASLPSTRCSGVHQAHLTPPTTSPLLALTTTRGPLPLPISWLPLTPSQEKCPDCPRSCSRRVLPDFNRRSLHQTTSLSLTWRVSNSFV